MNPTARRIEQVRLSALALPLMLVMLALFCAGCPLLMASSVAYQGYKYEKDQKATTAKKHPNSQPNTQKGPDQADNIE